MIDQLLIFTKGGAIVWAYKDVRITLKGSPVDALISSCLLEERSGSNSYDFDTYSLKWTFHNKLGLIFVAVYQRILRLRYVDSLLVSVKSEFADVYHSWKTDYSGFDQLFEKLRLDAEADNGSSDLAAGNVVGNKPGAAQQTLYDQDGPPTVVAGEGEVMADGRNGQPRSFLEDVEKKGSASNARDNASFNLQKQWPEAGKENVPAKERRKVKVCSNHLPRGRDTSRVMLGSVHYLSQLTIRNVKAAAANRGMSMEDIDQMYRVEDEDEDLFQINLRGWLSSMLLSFIFSLLGKATVERADLDQAWKALKERLMTKNVAVEIAEKFCESVATSLEGKRLASLVSKSAAVQVAVEDALVRIFTPQCSVDILREVHVAKEQGKPYVIVFVGANGVGKSTNLAKVAYWLLQHKLSVMMAACDTFRSGAVEELRVHAQRLHVPIFEKGYGKNPAAVAKEAIEEATSNGLDVVLVDTAGQMQGNEPAMRTLSKLMHLSNPDLVLFVGEALAGNVAADQLSQFNQKLADLSSLPNPRLIDGILLTKLDTVDSKVGAALSMVYQSGFPVIFVGCGQAYKDLTKFDVKSFVKMLLN